VVVVVAVIVVVAVVVVVAMAVVLVVLVVVASAVVMVVVVVGTVQVRTCLRLVSCCSEHTDVQIYWPQSSRFQWFKIMQQKVNHSTEYGICIPCIGVTIIISIIIWSNFM
jgi:hypothetical protein